MNNFFKATKSLNTIICIQNLGISMLENELNKYRLKVPSMMELVTINNIKKFIEILPKLSDTFENEHIRDIKNYPINNENGISRVLSYFKYLGILYEERTKETKGDKTINKQLFHLTDKGKELKEIVVYEPDKIYTKWNRILKESELYYSLTKNEDYQKWGYIPKNKIRKLLGESFKSTVKDTKERVDMAEKFLIDFLQSFDLFKIENDCLIPVEKTSEDDISKYKEKIKDISDTNEDIYNNKQKDEIDSKEKFYHAKTDDYELKVKYDELAIDMLKKQIEIARMKLDSMKKSKKEYSKLTKDNNIEKQDEKLLIEEEK